MQISPDIGELYTAERIFGTKKKWHYYGYLINDSVGAFPSISTIPKLTMVRAAEEGVQQWILVEKPGGANM